MSQIGALRDLLVALLQEHERDGALPTSARFLYYELVQRGQASKTSTGKRRPDQNLHDALTDVREDGRIPWNWIVDETRSLDDYAGSTSIKQAVLDVLPFLRLDPWRGRVPMILTESRSLAGVLRSVVSAYACRIAATNGQCGGFLRTNIAPKLQPDDRVLYLGDLDLAGDQIETNTQRVLQVAEHKLPPIVKHDRRYNDGHPHGAVETEALSQTVLVDILRRRLDALLPEPLSRVQERAERQRRRVATMMLAK